MAPGSDLNNLAAASTRNTIPLKVIQKIVAMRFIVVYGVRPTLGTCEELQVAPAHSARRLRRGSADCAAGVMGASFSY